MATRLEALGGTSDLLPAETVRWQAVEQSARQVLARYGFQEVRTPIIEYAEVFLQSLGEATEVVQKQMYTFQDRGGREIVLRPEGTASAVRAYLEHGLDKTGGLVKWYYIGPMFTAFRGMPEATQYYDMLWSEVEARMKEGKGPVTPDGELAEEKYRLVVEGPPNWTHFRDFWKMFYDEGAVVVASTYSKVGGVYDFGFRHDPDRPLESLAEYCLGCYTNLNFPQRIDMICRYLEEYQADGLLVNSIKSCNSFSAGQLLILREVEKRTGKPAAFIESDLVDPRYFSAANIRNRLESYFQMIKQKRAAQAAAVH
jgi:hypothetical protein